MTAEERTSKIEDYIAKLDAEWPEVEKIMASHELDLDTGREPLFLCRIPPDMDFTIKDGHTEYEVVGHFAPDGDEFLLEQISRKLRTADDD
ncbi:hypothetical protein [Oscillibacter sp.]|jgi:hypothetical protein|uniref:hypothetical protein n=1 Tax=Oscillibacter sp. TaxID=1945593 RepID=UPI0021726E79|nr:hypothetical protein [Oscillibacter sp.]MCI9649220.1 hypothetical protein [Oscillibacter sp.]